MSDRNEAQELRDLHSITRQVGAAVHLQITSGFQLLNGVAIAIGETGLNDSAELSVFLDQVNRSNDFVRMGFSGPDGKATLVDLDGTVYRDVDFASSGIFRSAIEGKDAVSPTVRSVVVPEYVNYYAVPVVSEGTIVGVLFAANPESALRNILDKPVFHGLGFSAIMDGSGTIVSPRVTIDGAQREDLNHLQDLGEFAPGELARVQEALLNGQEGSFLYSRDGKPQILSIVPLGANGWFIFSTIEKSAIIAVYNQTTMGVIAIVLGASLVFFYLLYRQRRLMLRTQAMLERYAYEDDVTGERNYTKFQIDASALLRGDPALEFVVWSLDVKRFKVINEVLGTAVGDRFLRNVAAIIRRRSQSRYAFFCRVSGDHFAGIRPFDGSQETLHQAFDALREEIAEAGGIPLERIPIDVSAGVYCVEPDDRGEPVASLINRASVAKLAAKRQAGSTVTFYSQEMVAKVMRETDLEASAPRALQNGEFLFYVQPKVSIRNGYRVAGGEALARWRRPGEGIVSPAEFIPVLERSGLISELDRYIFEEACKWYATRLRDNPAAKGITIAVNVSRLDLMRGDLVETYTNIKRMYDIPDGVFELEFTESLFMDDYTLVGQIVDALHAEGFICAIDDFGAGYSSLNILKNLPMDILKLDMMFFSGQNDTDRGRVIVSRVLEMARDLGIVTVAEGVEKEEQILYLQRAGCEIVQGYGFSRPLTVSDFEDYLSRPVELAGS